MNSEKMTARFVGVLLISAMVSAMLSGVFLESLEAPNYLTAFSANGNQVLLGVLLMIALAGSVVSIPIVMYPILKKHNERLAFGYIGARIFEGFADVLMAIIPLVLLTLSREYADIVEADVAYFENSATLLLGAYNWISILENIPYCLGALMLFYSLNYMKLIPRWLSFWGLIGATLWFVSVPFRMFSVIPQSTTVLAFPLVLSEMVLAVWLIVKGFSSSTFDSALPDVHES